MKKISAFLFVIGLGISFNANAWFFFFVPLPTSMPASFHNQIKTLEESNQTKAFAYAGEDKTFGSKYYVAGWYLGDLSQKEAIKIALQRCNVNLEKAKQENNSGIPRWNFGDKKCELYGFPKMPETAEMPTPEELAKETSPVIDIKPTETFVIPVKSDTSPVLPKVSKPVESKPQVTPLVQPLNATEGGKRLLELKSLLDQGVITQQDYDAKKAQILKSM